MMEKVIKLNHQHIYDKKGKQLCCSQENKINKIADNNSKKYFKNSKNKLGAHTHADDSDHDHSHDLESKSQFELFMPASLSLALLLLAIALDQWIPQTWFQGVIRFIWYIVAYIPVGFPVLKEAFQSIKNGEIFSEFLLMGIATIGAFIIGEYPEGVAVMLFYAVGEVFQTLAVTRAKANIKLLLDQRPDEVTINLNNKLMRVRAENVQVGSILHLKPGEKLALDGILKSTTSSFNTAALTGESKPETKRLGDSVLAGMINLNTVSEVEVTALYEDSKLSKILELVQNASSQKAPTELFIRKFAKIYTPIIVALAVLIAFLPFFIVDEYIINNWVYRALVFLVISCPCALVISIPLGYFGGIGAASRNGILVKGSNYLDILAKIDHVVMDKTGTLTEGVFEVQEIIFDLSFDKNQILQYVSIIEKNSSHPVATAIQNYVGKVDSDIKINDVEEISGHGLKGYVNNELLLVGNFKLMDKFQINYDVDVSKIVNTVIAVSFSNQFVGYLIIADTIKKDASSAIARLTQMGIKTTMLSGDKNSVVQNVAQKIGVVKAFGDLLPEDKVAKVKLLKEQNQSIAFVGDGINDAPVIALSDVGIAMGGLGSDATIETADVVIQDDQPSKIAMSVDISRQTRKIVLQNVGLAFGVKAIVLVLGAGGLATMWEAVFADVGVALIAILNAIRIQRMKF